MNKSELVKELAAKANVTQTQADAVLKAFEETVVSELKKVSKGKDGKQENGKIALLGFGTFEVVNKAARTSRNLATGATIQVPACKAPKFKFSKTVKDSFK